MRYHLLRRSGEGKTERHTHQPSESSKKFSASCHPPLAYCLGHLLLRFRTKLAKPMLFDFRATLNITVAAGKRSVTASSSEMDAKKGKRRRQLKLTTPPGHLSS